MKSLHSYIGGRFVPGKRGFADINPADGSVAATVTEASAEMVDEAVAAARKALHGEWGKLGARGRATVLYKIAEGIEKRFDCFVQAEVADTGKPLSLASRLDVPRAAANFRVFADVIKIAGLEAFETELPDGRRALNYTVRKPIGVVGIVTPWNLPLLLLTWKVAPALACGNAVVVKPSEETPATATLLAEVMQEAGVPDGVYNVVHGFGPNSAGEFLVSHPGVNAVTFTGESQTGASIMRACAPTVKPVSFELGGKNAAVIFADCDFDATIAGMSDAVFLNTGQVCLCAERVYVERRIFDRFVAALTERAKSYDLGWPMEPATSMGPLISKVHREKVLSYFDLAREEGATVVIGGGVPTFGDGRDSGFYVQPTIFTGLKESARCVKEEIFGPVCHVAPFDSEEEAVALANDTRYGLAASIWTSDLQRAHRVAPQMNAGITWVNCWFLRDLRTPFGGVGLSGIGREGGMHSLNFYSELNNICIRTE
ncbi:Betaine-aldehyde dehydrogenase [Candidatus Koribacter versatilis Ellin345]|uniref:Betaine-aldehyde dehydrogenase n=1 Tax=Koribacter versatilis (strain Ellin345) TaxID=204669 RepID=Q1ITW0_KORVE|nr:2-hydroxymuconic semialdehyde dehydrogenase [Candidatus Koribacter versatilis]ABF39690.1 Betaine-aldehyde dehydrogenase [Candidatus Koribacter versatilis Ellin345]